MRIALAALVACAALAVPAPAPAASAVRFGIHDDAWIASGPGSLDSRLDRLRSLGVDLVRFTIRWDAVARRRPRNAENPADRAYGWRTSDAVLNGRRARGIGVLVTLYGTPAWANGRRSSN